MGVELPRPGTKTRRVFDLAQQGVPRSQINALDPTLSKRAVHSAMNEMFERGTLQKPESEKSEAERRDAIRRAKGSIWNDVVPYLELGMTTLEIRQAVLYKKGIDIPFQKISWLIGRSRKHKLIRRLFDEEKDEIKVHNFDSEEEIRERTELWVDAIDLLEEGNLQNIPKTRIEWFLVMVCLNEQRKSANGDDSACLIDFETGLKYVTPEIQNRLQPCIEFIDKYPEEEEEKKRQARIDEAQAFFRENGFPKVVGKKQDLLLLAEFLDARKRYAEGDRNLLAHFGEKWDQVSPEIQDRLRPYMNAIISRTQIVSRTRRGRV